MDDRAVGQRIRERHSHFEDVCARAVERGDDAFRARQIGIAGGDVGDEPWRAVAANARKGFRQPACPERVEGSLQRLVHALQVLVAAA